jgi:hypothetical protein
MSTVEGLAAPTSREADGLADAVRGDVFGSGIPRSISGSSSSSEDNNRVGINPESEGEPGTDVLGPDEVVKPEEAVGTSVLMSSSTPCASRSSSEFIGPFDVAVGGADAELAAEEGRAPPTCETVPFNPKGSSTGRSAKGSKAGREAASIVFEPESGDQS